MKTFSRFVACVLLTYSLASISAGEDTRLEEIAWDQVPAKVMDVANEAEQLVEWDQALKAPGKTASGAPSYVLKGRIVVRAQQERITGDGDIEVIPGEIESVEVSAFEDGSLIYVVKSLPMIAVPAEVTEALNQECDLIPNYAYAARTSLKGKPVGYIFWIDTKGFLQYFVSADGKTVKKS